jgi:hypothetical protein
MEEESTRRDYGNAGDGAEASLSGLDTLSARQVVLGALQRVARSPKPKRRQIDVVAHGSPSPGGTEAAGQTSIDPVSEILRSAEALGIPWKRILVDEIQAERRLRRSLGNVEKGCSLRPLLRLLASSSLRSWRARDQIERLSRRARNGSTGDAVKELRTVFCELVGARKTAANVR